MVKVFHAPDELFYTRDVEKASAAFRAGRYTLVAELDLPTATRSAALERAFEQTNSGTAYWGDNPLIRVHNAGPEGHRSTSVGDVIERDGAAFMVASVGFLPLA